MCVSTKLARHNTTVIDLFRRLLKDVALANINVTWVKVRGHLKNKGNDQADTCAAWGMNGSTKHVLEVAQYVNDIMGRTAWRTDPNDAAHDSTVLDVVSDAEQRLHPAPGATPE